MVKIIELPYYVAHFIKKIIFRRGPFFSDLWHGIALLQDPGAWHSWLDIEEK